MEHEDYLGVYEAARECGCSSQWIRVLLGEQRLPGAFKRDGRWLIPLEALEEMKQRREQAVAQ